MLSGRATAVGTARYAARAVDACACAPDHFRSALGLTLSSLGFGMSIGDPTDEVDARYRLMLAEAIRCGCNVLDTAASYRGQRSEVVLGETVARLVAAGEVGRDELVILSKAGFITYDPASPSDRVQYIYEQIVRPGIAEPAELAGGIHCMAPNYLSQQVARSLRALGLRALDFYLIQNPETQLAFVDRATFRNRLQLAFARLEEEVAAGRIGCYGVATWEGLRRPPMSPGYMSLEIMVRLAAEVAGPRHHLRLIQAPVNAAMPEAVVFRNQSVGRSVLPMLDAARELGLTVMTTAALRHGQLPARAAVALAEAFPELAGPPQRALQFARSLPGITTAIFATTSPEHVRDDLTVAGRARQPERALRVAQGLAR